MASEMVNSATSEKLGEMDWGKNIAICELVGQDQSQCKQVLKAIKKRLSSKHGNTQLYAVVLLEMLMNNIAGDHIHVHLLQSGILPILLKIVKKKSDLPVRERAFLLLDATQTSLGGASGKFPQYYTAYYDLVSSGVQFPQRAPAPPPPSQPQPPPPPPPPPESSIIEKATNAYQVLKDVLDALHAQGGGGGGGGGGAKEEFTLDLVEQCSFQKQRVMHLVMASRDENLVSRAIDLNDKLQKVLARHDALLSAGPTSASGVVDHRHLVDEEEEEEEAQQLFRRLRKGKACARPEDEDPRPQHMPVIPGEMLNRPLIRARETAVVIPPPPAKHMEREKYFKENKGDGHSRNASSSRSESIDSD